MFLFFRRPLNNLEIVARCAYLTNQRGWKLFSIQFWGECWGDQSTNGDYERAGTSDQCYSGLGRAGTNFVYQFYEA